MPYKNKTQQREYQRNWIARRRKEWLDENGPCADCGSEYRLEMHHKDPSEKISHNVWSWSLERRLKELAKCVVKCWECHHHVDHKHIPAHGTHYEYSKRGCRCSACTEAHRVAWAEYSGRLV